MLAAACVAALPAPALAGTGVGRRAVGVRGVSRRAEQAPDDHHGARPASRLRRVHHLHGPGRRGGRDGLRGPVADIRALQRVDGAGHACAARRRERLPHGERRGQRARVRRLPATTTSPGATTATRSTAVAAATGCEGREARMSCVPGAVAKRTRSAEAPDGTCSTAMMARTCSTAAPASTRDARCGRQGLGQGRDRGPDEMYCGRGRDRAQLDGLDWFFPACERVAFRRAAAAVPLSDFSAQEPDARRPRGSRSAAPPTGRAPAAGRVDVDSGRTHITRWAVLHPPRAPEVGRPEGAPVEPRSARIRECGSR